MVTGNTVPGEQRKAPAPRVKGGRSMNVESLEATLSHGAVTEVTNTREKVVKPMVRLVQVS